MTVPTELPLEGGIDKAAQMQAVMIPGLWLLQGPLMSQTQTPCAAQICFPERLLRA